MFTIDEIYGVDFETFCKHTFTTPDLFIAAIKAEITMLQKSYETNRQLLQTMLLNDPNRDRKERLCKEIQRRLQKKKSKLKKYQKIAANMISKKASS